MLGAVVGDVAPSVEVEVKIGVDVACWGRSGICVVMVAMVQFTKRLPGPTSHVRVPDW